jgi:hypothetical protein
MIRYKGRTGQKVIEREFPYVVEVAVPAGGLDKRFDAMHSFHAARGVQACIGLGRREGTRDHLRRCFTRAVIAEAFAAEFDGSYLRAQSRKP